MKRKTGGSGDRGIEKALVLGLLCLFCSSIPRSLRSSPLQCPDGTPPPCAGQRAPALNPNRIAILPFRVTAADTLLGQGMAELLAQEFNGESGPLAVNMATVLRVWRRAGGSPATPLEPAATQGVARTIGAGRLIDGTVVGLGGTITLTASVVELPRGTARRIGPLSGPADSLQSLVGRLASGLLGAAGGTAVDLQIRLTDSPAAMRAYLEGLARYRVGDYAQAKTAFERAFAFDSLFARAAFMRFVTSRWTSGNPAEGGWDTVMWRLRGRLSARDRILLSGAVGDSLTAWTSPAARLEQVRRAAQLLPESPEAQTWLGDYLYHFGAATDIHDDFASARAQFELAWRLDPQFEVLVHLLEIGFFTGDTGMVRRTWNAWERGSADSGITVAYGRVAAMVLGDTALAARFAAGRPDGWMLPNGATMALLPANDVARLLGQLTADATAGVKPWFALNTGRLSWLSDSLAADSLGWLMAATLEMAGEAIVAPLAPRAARFEAGRERTRAASVAVLAALRSPGLRELRAATQRLDSTVRWAIANGRIGLAGHEGLLLSVAWEALGDLPRALAAVRLDNIWTLTRPLLLAPKLRREGRLAALTGDTARAIRAYRRYLSFRRDADPVLVPERDSVAVALARLEGR